MAFRFQKRIRVAPGVRLNISKSGLSVSLGGKGISHNIGHGKQKTTIGLHGTGLSHTTEHNRKPRAKTATPALQPQEDTPSSTDIFTGWLIVAAVIGTLIYFFG